jgi:hypothetical protein
LLQPGVRLRKILRYALTLQIHFTKQASGDRMSVLGDGREPVKACSRAWGTIRSSR